MTVILIIVVAIVGITIVSLALSAAIDRRFPPEGSFHPVAGGRMHLLRSGLDEDAATTVLLIHGATAALDDQIVALGQVLSPGYRVIAVDRPGHGWSDRPGKAGDASPIRQAALIVEAVRSLGVERAVVVGHSLGAAVAAAMALEHPSFVRGVVFIAPATHPWPGGVAWNYRLAGSPAWGRLFTTLVAPIAGSMLLAPGIRSVFAPQFPPSDYARRTGAARAVTPARFQANAEDVVALHANVTALSRRYRDIAAPCVIVTGDTDSVVWPSIHSEGLARDIPGARLVALPGVGHMPHHARPDVILAAIDDIVMRAKTRETP